MDPAEVDRRANWFRLSATNSSITVPNKYASQLALPALLYISGMIRAAVIVGDIKAIAIAVTPVKPRQLVRNPVSVSLFSISLCSPQPTSEAGCTRIGDEVKT